MTFEEFVPLAIKTETKNRPLNLGIIDLGLTDRMVHAFMGFATEIDEYNIAMKNKDRVNALEELGDMLWYSAILKDEIDFSALYYAPHDVTFDLSGLDLVKKTMFYGKELDINKLKACATDMHIKILHHIMLLEGDPKKVMETIIAKLKARYGEKFTDEAADKRDLGTERAVLEDGLK
jgi:hypothetical protein